MRLGRALAEEEWDDLRQTLDAPAVWRPSRRGGGVDGTTWILERAWPGQHEVALVWSPKSDGPEAAFRAACSKLLELGALDLVRSHKIK